MKKILILLLASMLSASTIGCSKETKLIPQDTADNIVSANYSGEFNGINGCAVFYNSYTEEYTLYNEQMCYERYSPYSTFKIIGVLEGLKQGVIDSGQSTMHYSGNNYPFESWNKNLTLYEAFQTSCVWYFRQVIDKIGQNNMQTALNNINYGNCDISEWKGSGLNPQAELNGFWLGSSLKISPMEQVKVISDIFEGRTNYTTEQIAILKNVMTSNIEGVYGKTGTGLEPSAWYTGFYENSLGKIYFAVYMQDDTAEKLAGAAAKETANKIIDEYYRE